MICTNVALLAQRIEQTPNIELLTNAEIIKMTGRNYLEAVSIRNSQTGEVRSIETPAVFSFIGAPPHTDWLLPHIATDDKGFVKTGHVDCKFTPMDIEPSAVLA